MRLTSSAIVLLCVSAFVSCRTSEPRSGGPSSFSQAFETFESRRGDDGSAKPRGTLVDYESEILVQPDIERLSEMAGRPGGEPTAEIKALESRSSEIEDVTELLRQIADYEEESLDYFTEHHEEGTVLQDDPRWRSFTTKQRDIVTRLRDLVHIYVNQTTYEGKWNWEEEDDETRLGIDMADVDRANTQVSEIYGKLAPTTTDSANNLHVRYDREQITELVNALNDVMKSRIRTLERAILEESPEASLEMEAALLRGKERVPVSITPYTTVAGVGRGEKSGRVGIPSAEDVARVQKEYEAYAELADAINELIDIAGDDTKLRELRDQVLAALKKTTKRIGDGIEDELERIVDEGELAPIHDAARAVRDEIESIRQSVEALVEAAPSSDPIRLANQGLALLNGIRSGGLLDKIDTFTDEVANLPASISEASKSLVEATKKLLVSEAEQFRAALQDQPATGAIADLYGSLEKLSALAVRSFGDLEPGDVTRRPFALADAPVGIVNLADTPAESGDVLELSYKMTIASENGDDSNGNGGNGTVGNADARRADRQPLEYQGASFHDIRKFGLYSTFSAQVLFFDRVSDGSSSFRAAPGVAYNLHYRPERGQSFHDVVAPGLGLSVSAPSFEDGTELAIGAQLTLFNDMIQGGYAYNISVDDDPWMFYFAFDLIAAFQAIQ